jgi:hypothetical protein
MKREKAKRDIATEIMFVMNTESMNSPEVTVAWRARASNRTMTTNDPAPATPRLKERRRLLFSNDLSGTSEAIRCDRIEKTNDLQSTP